MQQKRAIILHRVSMADKDELVAANAANAAYHAPWVSPFSDDESFDVWFARMITGPHISLVAREPQTREAVGIVNLNEIVMGAFRSCFVGYYGYERWAHQGWMTAALRSAVRFAFQELGLHRIEANIQPDNLASARLAARAGFRKEGSSPRYLFVNSAWRDHDHWVILNEDSDNLGQQSFIRP